MRDYIVLAIPFFFLLIALEVLWARWQDRDLYRLNDSVNDLSCGILQQLLEVFLKTALFAGYLFLYEKYRLFEVPASALGWAACFVGVDFLYYWFHRMSHEVNAFWAAHVVHHQSEEFNLAVALRQGALQGSISWAYYLPLAVLGFSPLMFLACSSLNTLYQFWIHTRAIHKLGPLEWVMNTPSHHRVHHACNPKYIDRNYAGVFIVWDRLFGSFKEEDEEPAFGITKPLASWNPLWANLHYWAELFDKARRSRRLSDRLRLFVKPPGWQPEELGGFLTPPEIDRAQQRKFDPRVPPGLSVYVLVQFLLVLAFSSVLLFRQDDWPGGALAAGTVAAIVTLLCLGALLEGRRWAVAVEALRLGLAMVALSAYLFRLPRGGWAALLVVAAGTGLLAWLLRYRAGDGLPAPAPAPQTTSGR